MKIKSFEVHGLFAREGVIRASLHDDLNIITGRNGSGKTTLIKLIWYVISGNIKHAIIEIPFQKIVINTDLYQVAVTMIGQHICRVELNQNGTDVVFEDVVDDDGDVEINAEQQADNIIEDYGESLFLPTFRRIEGGFTLFAKRQLRNIGSSALRSPSSSRNDVEDGLSMLSRRLSNMSHTFICSISTVDVATMLLQRYAEVSQSLNDSQKSTSQIIIDQIKVYRREAGKSSDQVIDSIFNQIEQMDEQQKRIMAPFEAMTNLISQLFQHTGIQIGPRLSFGEAAGAINSDSLSAGEKQMLSFISYNAFYHNAVVFVDEPELSLHVDWQRRLFPVLENQKSSNQFIVATHSPFIYTKYPDREIMISSDRGDADATRSRPDE